MKKISPKILFDTNIFLHGVIGIPALEKQTIKWGDIEQEIEVLRTIRQPKKTGNQSWLESQIECLPTLGRLIKEKTIIACDSSEIEMELDRRSKVGNATVYAFRDCEFLNLPSPIERSKFSGSPIQIYSTGQALEDYCMFLLALSPDKIESLKESPFIQRFTDFERKNLDNIKLFESICGSIDKSHYLDAFHLWTAEVNNCDYFLTNEKKFKNEFKQKSSVQLNCKIVSPKELLGILNLDRLDSIKLKHGEYYSL